MKKKIFVLGSGGMLGNSVMEEFSQGDFDVRGTSRILNNRSTINLGQRGDKSLIQFDVLKNNVSDIFQKEWLPDYVVNCIGVTKTHIDKTNPNSVRDAIKINSLFPIELETFARRENSKIIQIATDCVYSGNSGNYSEEAAHDALDVYGKTKSLGEVVSSNVMHLRSSTIGPEAGRSTLLLEWVRNQPKNATINGFSDHIWNGVTTKAFARIARGIIETGVFRPGVQHLVPADKVDKDKLLRSICETYGRNDINVVRTTSDQSIDRTLSTKNSLFNQTLWEAGRYTVIPTIAELLAELACEEN